MKSSARFTNCLWSHAVLSKELDIINDGAPEKRPVPLDALGLLRRRPRGCLAHEKIGSTEGVDCGEGPPGVER
jgi:hypothetical protein